MARLPTAPPGADAPGTHMGPCCHMHGNGCHARLARVLSQRRTEVTVAHAQPAHRRDGNTGVGVGSQHAAATGLGCSARALTFPSMPNANRVHLRLRPTPPHS
eukprot:354212-Chlamydomonas_euryale.AAC.16